MASLENSIKYLKKNMYQCLSKFSNKTEEGRILSKLFCEATVIPKPRQRRYQKKITDHIFMKVNAKTQQNMSK